MSTKKKLLTIAGTIFGLLIIGFIALLTIGAINRATNGAKVDGNKITSAHFEVVVPENSTLTNEDKTSNNIYVTTTTDYGELRTSVTRSDWNITEIRDRGKVTTSDITVDGTPATMKVVDFSETIKGRSEKLLIRYRVGIDKIAQPSEDEYTTVEVTAMSKRNLTSAEEKDVEQKAQAIIESLVIK